jgi:hypothetical protein
MQSGRMMIRVPLPAFAQESARSSFNGLIFSLVSDMLTGSPCKRKVCLFLAVAVLSIGATTERTVYTDTSNKELKPRIMRLVNDIRQLVYAYKKKDGELLAASDQRDTADAAKEQRKKLRDQWIKDSEAAHDAMMRQYKEKYWADAILLRNELLRRLPKNMRQPQLSGIYQYPTNVLGVEVIADNLELLAKSLPEN